MRFFMPDWDDRVDPGYNFMTDEHSAAHTANPRANDAYMWEIFNLNDLPFDGVLVSKLQVDNNEKKARQVAEKGIHAYLRLPETFPVLGDCGAYGYINEDKPPLHTKEILDYYCHAGVNYAVSIDHLVVQSVRVLDADGRPTGETRELTRAEKEERVAITTKNGIDFWREWNRTPTYKERFVPLAAVQGENPADYAQCLRDILAGAKYTYVAIGGLVRRQTKDILKILQEIHPIAKQNKLQVHVFGVFRLEAIPEMYRLGVTSFDSASRLRKSWMSNHDNYYFQRRSYTGLRVPQPDESRKTRNLVLQNPDQYAALFQDLQHKCLSIIRDFHADPEKVTTEKVIDVLTEYTKHFSPDLKLLKWYRETLEERPWQRCTCPICKKIGVEVIIFRGNNRNRRRGFHNVYVEYHELRKVLETLSENAAESPHDRDETLVIKKGRKGKSITDYLSAKTSSSHG